MRKSQVNQALQLAGNQHRYQWLLILLISISWTALNFVLLGSTFVYMDPVFHCNGDFERKVFEKEACNIIEKCELVALIGGWKHSIPTVIFSQFLQGFGSSSILPLSYAFLSDYCSDKFKPRAVIIVNIAWYFFNNKIRSLSTVLLGVFYLGEVSWQSYLMYFTMIPLAVTFVLFQILILESPHILMIQHKRQEAIKVLEKVAKINKKEDNISEIHEIMNQDDQIDETKKASIKNVFKLLKKSQYFRPLAVLSILRIIGCLNFYGTSYAFDVEGLGLGYNSMIAGFMEVGSYLFLSTFLYISAILVNKIPRRKGISGFFLVVIFIGMFFWFDFVKNNMIAATMLLGISRIFSTIAYTLIASVQTQAFTNQIQSTAVAITEAFALLGAMSGPLIVDLGDKIGVDSVVLISLLVSFAVWPNYFLKETLKKSKKEEKNPLLNEEEQNNRESLLSHEEIKSESSESVQNPESEKNIRKHQRKEIIQDQ